MTVRRASRTSHITVAIMIGGFLMNFIATVAGFVSFAMSYEARMTRIETILELKLVQAQGKGQSQSVRVKD